MAVDAIFYAHYGKICHDGTVRWGTDAIQAALVTSAYTPSTAHDEWADVSTNEVATGAGYTTGGVTLGSVVVSNAGIDFADPAWTALTKTFRYVVFYANVTRNGLTNPLLAYYLPNDAPADTVVTASNWSVEINASGFHTFTLTNVT